MCICHEGMRAICDKYKYPEAVVQNLGHKFLGNVIFAQKMIVLSDMTTKEKIKEIRRIIRDSYLRKNIYEIKYNHENAKRKLYIFMIKHKCSLGCYLLLKLTTMKK